MKTKTIVRALVVDDDQPIREMLRCALEQQGYAVDDVEDGEAALAWLRASREPAVVLLDLRMPRLDGAGVLSAVARDRRLAGHHAFVLMTADLYHPSASFAQMLTSLQVPVLRKPFDLDELLDMVSALSGRMTAA